RQLVSEAVSKAEKAYTDRRFDDLNVIVRQVEEQFARFDDLVITHAVERTRTLGENGETFKKQQSALREELNRLERQLNTGEPAELEERLDQLKKTYTLVVRETEQFDQISREVARRQSVEVQINGFNDMLHNDDYAVVEREIRKARAALLDYPDDGTLRHAVGNLEVHAQFLKAQREAEVGQFENALKMLEEVRQVPGHPDRTRAESEIGQIERLQREHERANTRVEAAKSMMQTDPVAAYEELVSLGVISSVKLERKRQDLIGVAR